jgi:predicted amidohydrolase
MAIANVRVLRGGRVIDPANRIDGSMDVAVAGDIGTQIYSRVTAQPVSARNGGVIFDCSVGSDGLCFGIAQPTVARKVLPDTISGGMDSASDVLPGANLAASMSIFLNL